MRSRTLRRTGLAALVAAGGIAATSGAASAAVFTVTTVADTGAGSLRQAITAANAASGADEVRFNIPGTGPRTIAVSSAPLPAVTGRLKIDGTTQPGFTGAPRIRIDNATGTTFTDGLTISAGQSQVLSLSITSFGAGVALTGSGGNVVTGSRLGVTPGGDPKGNVVGAVVQGSPNNTIGGTAAGARNVISANGEGIVVIDADGTKIQGNLIGTNPAGSVVMGNQNAGIRIAGGATATKIGGTDAGARNVISGNRGGININGAGTSDNVVAGNRIGTDEGGKNAMPNQFFGIGILGGATANTIGGTSTAARNVISGNTNAGAVSIGGAGTSGNVVAGNLIGTTVSGAAALPNQFGVLVTGGATGNTVGGNRSDARNVISGNAGAGVQLDGNATSGNTVAGNHIGVSLDGTAALPNTQGVVVLAGPDDNVIGGSSADRRNVISGNLVDGVVLGLGGTTGNRVSANYIGTSATGAAALPNGGAGVDVFGGASGNTIGGTVAGERNVISGNQSNGVVISESPSNVVAANYVGLAVNGADPLGNGARGVQITGAAATGNRVGGTGKQRNVIAGNALGGVRLTQQATGNVVQNNFVGTAADGSAPIANAGDGIALDNGASGNTVGGTDSGTGNTIAFNGGDGVSVDASETATSGDAILRNALFDNAQLGIALVGGANGGQPAPAITSVTTTATETTIQGTLTGARAGTTQRIETFVSAACDASGAGEGERFLGAKSLKTNADGDGTFTLKIAPLAPGQWVTATATPAAAPQSTSEFSVCAVT